MTLDGVGGAIGIEGIEMRQKIESVKHVREFVGSFVTRVRAMHTGCLPHPLFPAIQCVVTWQGGLVAQGARHSFAVPNPLIESTEGATEAIENR